MSLTTAATGALLGYSSEAPVPVQPSIGPTLVARWART